MVATVLAAVRRWCLGLCPSAVAFPGGTCHKYEKSEIGTVEVKLARVRAAAEAGFELRLEHTRRENKDEPGE